MKLQLIKVRQFTFLLLLAFFPLCYSLADNAEPLYFIKATPQEDPYLYDEMLEPAYLCSLQNGQLDTIQKLSSYDNRINHIDYYVDHSTIVITNERKYTNYGLMIINTQNLCLKNIEYPILKEYPNEFKKYRMIVEKDTSYLSINCFGSMHWRYIENAAPQKMEPELLLNFHSTISNSERITYDSIRNCFTLPVIQLKNEEEKILRPVLPYKIQRNDYPKDRWLTAIWIKNNLYSIIGHTATDSARTYIVYQNQNNMYNHLTLRGNTLNGNIWGDWLGAVESYKEDFEGIDKVYQKNNATLYLYNIPQNRMIKWNSHSNNAAILHIENSEVYYRINDTLYKAPILENSIGTPQVIYQSSILKHVNWLWK